MGLTEARFQVQIITDDFCFVDPRAHLNNSRRSINESLTSSREDIELNMRTILPALNGLKLDRAPEPLPELPSHLDGEIQELNFHRYILQHIYPRINIFECLIFINLF